MPCIAFWFIVFAMPHGLFVFRISWAKEVCSRLCTSCCTSLAFFCFMVMEKCVFNGKWKADEKFKAWIAADPTSKTKAKCVVCNKAIDISIIGEAAGGWKMLLLLKGLWRCQV